MKRHQPADQRMADFYQVLKGAISESNARNASHRSAIYERARRLLKEELDLASPRFSRRARQQLRAALEKAIDNIESEAGDRPAPTDRLRATRSPLRPSETRQPFLETFANETKWRERPVRQERTSKRLSLLLLPLLIIGAASAAFWRFDEAGPHFGNLSRLIMSQLGIGIGIVETAPAEATLGTAPEMSPVVVPQDRAATPTSRQKPESTTAKAPPAVMSSQVPAEISAARARIRGPFDQGFAAYEKGDFSTAIQLWRPLAERGHSDAQINVGAMYSAGLGVPQDRDKAVKWFREAAEHGYPAAKLNLGVLYFTGQGLPRDYVEAYKWWELSLTRFPTLEGPSRSIATLYRDMAASRMTPAQIIQARRLAREWESN